MNSPHRSTKPLYDVTCIRPHEMQTKDALISIPQTDGLETHTREWNEKKSRNSIIAHFRGPVLPTDILELLFICCLFVCLFVLFGVFWGSGGIVLSLIAPLAYTLSHLVHHPTQYPTLSITLPAVAHPVEGSSLERDSLCQPYLNVALFCVFLRNGKLQRFIISVVDLRYERHSISRTIDTDRSGAARQFHQEELRNEMTH